MNYGKKTENSNLTSTVSGSNCGGLGRSFSLPGKREDQIKASRVIDVFVSSIDMFVGSRMVHPHFKFPLVLKPHVPVEPHNHPYSYRSLVH